MRESRWEHHGHRWNGQKECPDSEQQFAYHIKCCPIWDLNRHHFRSIKTSMLITVILDCQGNDNLSNCRSFHFYKKVWTKSKLIPISRHRHRPVALKPTLLFFRMPIDVISDKCKYFNFTSHNCSFFALSFHFYQ